MANQNKVVEAFTKKETNKWLTAGYWPEAGYNPATGGLFIHSYFEVMRKFDKCYDIELKKLGIADGVYTRVGEKKLTPLLEELSKKIVPCFKKDLSDDFAMATRIFVDEHKEGYILRLQENDVLSVWLSRTQKEEFRSYSSIFIAETENTYLPYCKEKLK